MEEESPATLHEKLVDGATSKYVTRPQMVSRVLDMREARAEFGVGKDWLYRHAAKGLIHPIQVGGKGRIYYPEWEIRALLARDNISQSGQLEFELTA